MVGTSGSTDERVAGRGAERAHLPGLDVRRHGGDRIEHHLHMAADHAVARLARGLVRHVHQVGAAQRFEQFARHMVRRAGAGRRIVEAARLRLRQRDEFLQVLRLHRRVDHHDQVGVVDPRHRHEVAHQRERLVGHERLVDRVGVRHRQQRVAVGRRLRDLVGADDRSGARLVLDHDRLLQRLGEILAELAGEHVGGTAGAERHDDLDRLRRKVLRGRQVGPCHRDTGGEQQRPAQR